MIEGIASVFATGYHAGLEADRLDGVAGRLSEVPLESRGFAFEGAGMALALRDGLFGRRFRSVQRFIQGAGAPHAYMVHVGAGWAMARLPWGWQGTLARFDPLLRWLLVDGWGFHEGFFHPTAALGEQRRPARLTGYGLRAFDQGLGRSLCFVEGGDVREIAGRIGRFPAERQGDLWSGVGLAAAYSGIIAPGTAIEILRKASGAFHADLAQGAAFAAKARLRASNPTPRGQAIVEALCGCPWQVAAGVTDEALEGLPDDGAVPAFAVWRDRIRTCLASSDPATVDRACL